MKKNILFASLVVLITTLAYAFFFYQMEKIDRVVIFERIHSAYDDGQLLSAGIPPLKYGLGSRNNLSGMDQMGESLFARMFMYQGKENLFLEALLSGYYTTVNPHVPSMDIARQCVVSTPEQRANPSLWKVEYKPRLWHGIKAVMLPLLQYLDLSQISWLITISTFFLFALISTQVMFFDKKTGLAYIAFTASAFYCSSVLFFGGVTYSVPLLAVTFWAVLWLTYRMLFSQVHRRLELLFITFGGTWLCFFFQQGGEKIYAFSFIAFVEVFLSRDGLSAKNIYRVIESWCFFLFGFLGSIFCKHVLIVLLSGSLDPLFELISNMLYRTSATNDAGSQVDLFRIVYAQFHWYGIAAYGIGTIHDVVNASAFVAIALIVIVSVWLLVLKILKQHKQAAELGTALIGFLCVLAPVPLRYMILRNHSDMHIFFVSRYLFVFAGTSYFFALWLVLMRRRFLPQQRIR